MALQLRTVSNKLFNPALNLVRNRSRISSLPSLFWEDPFKQQRNLMSELWNRPDPFDAFFAPPRYAVYRAPSLHWDGEENLSNPKDGFQVALNVENFKPEEVSVKVVDNTIIVEAKHEERSEDNESFVSRQFSRRYVLPDEYNIKDVVSKLSADGILTVKVPPKHLDEESARKIDIQQTGTPHFKPDDAKKIEDKKSDETNN